MPSLQASRGLQWVAVAWPKSLTSQSCSLMWVTYYLPNRDAGKDHTWFSMTTLLIKTWILHYKYGGNLIANRNSLLIHYKPVNPPSPLSRFLKQELAVCTRRYLLEQIFGRSQCRSHLPGLSTSSSRSSTVTSEYGLVVLIDISY